jgi:hypothetical protein
MVDLYIAGGLVGVVVIVYLLSRVKLLPEKWLPYLFLGLGAAVGFSFLRVRKRKKVLEQMNKIKNEIAKRENRLKELVEQNDIPIWKPDEIKAELDRIREAHIKESLLEVKKLKKEKERIWDLSGQDLLDIFTKEFGTG